MNKATMLEEEDRDELVYSKRDIDGLKSAMVTAVAKGEEEIARLRKMYERERDIAEQAQRDAEQWKSSAETQKENNLSLLDEVKGWKTGYKNMKEHRDVLVAENTKLFGRLQDALNTLNWYVDSSMPEYVDDAGVKAAETLDRIQEGTE